MCLEQIDKSLTAFDFRVYRRVYSSLYVLDDSVVVWFVYFFFISDIKEQKLYNSRCISNSFQLLHA